MVFVLDLEQWTNSTPSARSSRVRGTLSNQLTCVLWICVPRGILRGWGWGFSGIMGGWAPLCGLSTPSKTRVRTGSASSALSRTHSQ